ncbi:MAG: Acetyltransferase [Candidatus Gottesmanbacteria bacterium GW2011_GWC2_39_8]|uniref:Acetyltransferase n=1 Tax=Candidatus Gottesmanbacteria bacterium GW2011_GWC2_39_8 TaxID=1618450 RepID=A0A0G0Q4K7_9BACT|nr:MAG: Acetyltransferase [Candidatus Gottesmanbacteria bacterium GW2011_GWC2_39_8]
MFKDKNGRKLRADAVLKKILNRIGNIFLDLELAILRGVGNIPLHSIRRLFYRMAGIGIGKGSTVHMWCNFFFPGNIKIGEDTIIGDHAFLDGRAFLTIGNHVAIASHVLIYNSEHDLISEDFHAILGEVVIGDYVFIGPRAVILPGVKIGKGAVVAAGAVVTSDVQEYTVVGGVPAKVIGERGNKNLHYRLGRARLFQ